MKTIISILFLFILASCLRNKSTFDKDGRIEKLGTPVRLEYYKCLQGQALKISDTADFVITDHKELKDIINEIKNADNPEPWKGAGWNRIKIYYLDTILSINTNNKKIGISSSGEFYDLNKNNFITKHIKER